MIKTQYRSVDVTLGGTKYRVTLRVIPAKHSPHVGADSPEYLRPGIRRRIQVIRILRAGEEPDLFWATRQAIEREAVRVLGGTP